MIKHALVLTLALTLVSVPAAQVAPPAAHAVKDPAALSDAEQEQFLQKARVVRTRSTAKGVTGSVRATLSDGTITHDAHIQTIDESKFEFRAKDSVEFNFRDTWRFNIAVYKIDRMLGLQLVPVSVERHYKGRGAAYTWWVDDVMMDEGDRIKKNMAAPNRDCWNEQTRLMRMLDQLIDNIDRNLGNMLITSNWRIWAIDHTRAFRYSKTPRKPEHLTQIDRTILQRLETLEFATLKREIGKYVTDGDIRSLLSRRDAIVAHFKGLGDGALYERADPAVGCAQ